MNTPGGNTISTAEHTIALMLALSRNIAPRLPEPDRRPLGPQEVTWARNWPARPWASSAWAASARPWPRGPAAWKCRSSATIRSCRAGRAKELGIETVRVGQGHAAARRLPDRPHAAERRDAEPDRRQGSATAEEGRAADQLRPRRHLRRGGAGRRAQERAACAAWRWTCIREEPCTKSPLFGMPGVLCTPAPRRQHRGGPNQRGRGGGRAADRLLHHRRDQAVGQHVAAGSRRRWPSCAAI